MYGISFMEDFARIDAHSSGDFISKSVNITAPKRLAALRIFAWFSIKYSWSWRKFKGGDRGERTKGNG